MPKVQFREPLYTGEEDDGQITVTVYRSGDIRHKSTVRCYTRQGSAQVVSDFDERPNTDASIITFLPGALTQGHHICLFLSAILKRYTGLIKHTAPVGIIILQSHLFFFCYIDTFTSTVHITCCAVTVSFTS